ncbi:MAG: hypothetical protein IPK19_30660 [Chloroflexi bacterium]|nr:hypothetical protein [Chloroflexota bacterium]
MLDDDPGVPDYLEPTMKMLNCAYPNGVLPEDYWGLLAVLHTEMSFRTLAHALSIVTGKTKVETYNDAAGFTQADVQDPTSIDRAMERLKACGYDEWLESD